MTLYSLKEKETGQWHIFECHKEGMYLKNCVCERHSICNHMELDRSQCFGEKELTCLDEQAAREKCAEIDMGRKVCGTCVSHLYADFKEE